MSEDRLVVVICFVVLVLSVATTSIVNSVFVEANKSERQIFIDSCVGGNYSDRIRCSELSLQLEGSE